MLHQYVYVKEKGKRKKKGVLFGDRLDDGTLCIGFSSCSPRDEFDREFGVEVAVERAYRYCFRKPKKIPITIQNNLLKFVCRCQRYFKPEGYPNWLNDFIINKSTDLEEVYS
jgi:hypothetical protein